jgi:hypothetical protein
MQHFSLKIGIVMEEFSAVEFTRRSARILKRHNHSDAAFIRLARHGMLVGNVLSMEDLMARYE